jgi:hypothetical protein
MRLLIQSGADINAYRNDGCTPLHIAATFPSTNHIKCQLLIDHGADLHAQAGGLTPHDYAIAQGFHDTAKFLENPIKYRNAWPAADRPPDVPVRTPESTPFGEGSDRMPTNVDPVDVSILATTAAIEIAAVQALVAQQQEVSRSDNTDGAVLDVDWKLILDKTGIHSRLAAMQASIAASESAQRALRDANKALDGRVAANAAAIREHEHRIAQLEEQREVQSAQVSMLQSLESKPDHLLFYHTLQINIEAVFLSCKAVAGGFVDLGGDALSNRALTGTSNAIKVCGALLSLAPGGAIIKGVANVGAAALEHANSTRRQNIAHKLGKSMSLAEASQVASDVAYRLTLMFAEQLALLVSADTTSGASTKGSSGGGFPAFLKRACGVGGNLVAAYVTSGDGCEVIATAAEMAGDAVSESVGELIAAQSGALVGSVRGGPEPFASVLADFCFLVVLAELENVRVSETASDISKRLVRAVVMLKPTASADARASGGSGARRLLDRLCGFARSIMSSRPSRTLSVFVHSHDGASHGAQRGAKYRSSIS